MIADAEARGNLVKAVVELAANAKLQQELIENIEKFGVRNADEVIAKEILRSI